MTTEMTTCEAAMIEAAATDGAGERTRTRQIQVPHPKGETVTWGLELELYLPRGTVRVGSRHAGIELGHPFPPGWNAQHDGSLSTTLPNYEGVEIVSPILQGVDGLRQVKQVCALIEERRGRVNGLAGVHMHIGIRSVAGDDYDAVANWVRRFLLLAAHHELALYGASGTRRRYNGRYCASLRNGRWAQKKDLLKKRDLTVDELRLQSSGIDRYQLVNIQNLFGSKPTLELRPWGGTTEYLKLRSWISMGLALATRALDHTAEFDGANARYAANGAQGAIRRWNYVMGWTRGRKNWGRPTCIVEGWIGDLADLKPVKKELMRLAKKFDASPAT